MQYITLARSIETRFDPAAEALLQQYYVASRRLRGEAAQGAAIPLTAIRTLTTVATCHAKLALRR